MPELTREQCVSVLHEKDDGDFVIRKDGNSYVLMYRADGHCHEEKLISDEHGVYLQRRPNKVFTGIDVAVVSDIGDPFIA